MTTAVIGCGFVGSVVVERLAETSREPVRALSRSGAWANKSCPTGAGLVQVDVIEDSAERLRNVLAGVRRLVLCFAPGRDQDREALYIGGTTRVLTELDGLAIERVVYVSSTSALPQEDRLLDEQEPGWPEAARGRVQRQAEEVVETQLGGRGIPWTILRLAGVYGPGRELGRIYLRAPDDVQAGDGMQATNLIHRDDAVAAILASLSLPPTVTGRIHVCDDDHCSRRELIEHLAATTPGMPIPRWELAVEEGQLVRGKRVSNESMKSVLNIRLQYPTHL